MWGCCLKVICRKQQVGDQDGKISQKPNLTNKTVINRIRSIYTYNMLELIHICQFDCNCWISYFNDFYNLFRKHVVSRSIRHADLDACVWYTCLIPRSLNPVQKMIVRVRGISIRTYPYRAFLTQLWKKNILLQNALLHVCLFCV